MLLLSIAMSIFRENSDRGIRTGEPDSQAMEEGIKQLGLFYGISGLQVVTQPGAGWACAKTEDGITIIVDPEQTIKGNSTEETLPEHPPVPPEITSLFIGGHEIGHANDYLEPDYWKPSQPSPERDFFDGLIDDLVIDRRNRRVPLLDAYADDIYGYQLPNDLTDLPNMSNPYTATEVIIRQNRTSRLLKNLKEKERATRSKKRMKGILKRMTPKEVIWPNK